MTINYISVFVAAVAAFAFGAIWYGPLFGKQWMAMMGFTKESMKMMKLTPAQAMGLGFVTAIIVAYVLAYFAAALGVQGASGALSLAFLVWLGFVATTLMGSFLWEGKPFKLFAFNAVYQLISFSIMSLIVVLWQ
ncbi:MAG: DUF1761 domain-containing protein [Candidatus Liptonbacteria bacterium]|nr:DUF1761 domain-containing protein [Candidatus Liptonbacteria bacterium]